jgi:hypothetical protein
LQSYDLAAKKEFIILARNLMHTRQYPDYHVIINFYKRMPVEDFAKMKSRAFAFLTRRKIQGYYAVEPTPSRNWLHIHMMAIYALCEDDLRLCIRLAWESVGLEYGKDFHVKIKTVGATEKDYKRLCAYILKFNGKRETNRFTPILFIKNLRLRKVGSFGKFFAKSKEALWKEYTDECRLKHEPPETDATASHEVIAGSDSSTDGVEESRQRRNEMLEAFKAAFRAAGQRLQERKRIQDIIRRRNRSNDRVRNPRDIEKPRRIARCLDKSIKDRAVSIG